LTALWDVFNRLGGEDPARGVDTLSRETPRGARVD
jgi:hypothetical protein